MKFVFKHMTQTQIGKLFGVTSHVIGDWLKEIGLRDADGKPTEEAHDGNFCKQAPSGPSGYHWAWDSEKTVAALRDAGYQLIPSPPQSLVAPAILHGPFSVQKAAGSEFVIENGDGSSSVWVNCQMTADVIARLLNASHQSGYLDRMCQPQRLLQTPLASDREISTVVSPFE